MAISDANKMLMLESEGAIETMVSGLLLTSPRRSEDGADAVQEACAALLLSLALHGRGRRCCGRHGCDACAAGLQDGEAGTEASRRSAESTLFELEGRKAGGDASAAVAQAGGAKHVMVSYCWEQQAVVKRVHAALVERGYRVWIDIEQMTGSTVDSMALAVENAEVMLIGVSREYKESTNCRLEAQYAMQREVPTMPLMLADGYRADGWLGMLIGTRMWYGFFGAVLSEEESVRGESVGAVSGSWGAGHGAAVAVAAGRTWVCKRLEPAVRALGQDGDDEPAIAALRSELRGLRAAQLRKRAAAVGVSAEAWTRRRRQMT